CTEHPGVHHQAVRHLLNRFQSAIELARSHSHSAAVQGGIATSINDSRAVSKDADPIAVTPNTVKALKVTSAVTFGSGISPQCERHRRHGLAQHELPHLVDQRL